jgi:hypothetical protein
MKNRVYFGFALGVLALAVSVGSSAAGRTVAKVHGKVIPLALYANNAGKLGGHSAAVIPKAGQIPVVGASGKLPRSILPVVSVGPAGAADLAGRADLAGQTGPAGPAGPDGAAGPAGPAGPAGKDLTSQTPLQSGQSESGFYAAGGAPGTNDLIAAITYAQPLAAAIPGTHVIFNANAANSPHCPGNGKADPGYLCLYDAENQNVSPALVLSDVPGFSQFAPTSWGAILVWSSTSSTAFVAGEYTVTAP